MAKLRKTVYMREQKKRIQRIEKKLREGNRILKREKRKYQSIRRQKGGKRV